ncbi:MAG TPA: hypothetical protein VNJ03_03310 [Vicinamibacterales bacterium]|nr:hypothetical protein [Vicinamibacterales bacterium]
MSNRTYGFLAGLIGVGAWLYSRRRVVPMSTPVRERGTVIFDNTPTATPLSADGVM